MSPVLAPNSVGAATAAAGEIAVTGGLNVIADISLATAIVGTVIKLFSGGNLHAVRQQEAATALQAALTAPNTIIKDENGVTHGNAVQFLIYESGNAATDEDKGNFRLALAQYYLSTGNVVAPGAAALLTASCGSYTALYPFVDGQALPQSVTGIAPATSPTTDAAVSPLLIFALLGALLVAAFSGQPTYRRRTA